MPPSVATGPHARAARTFARAATAHQTAGRRASIHTKPPSLSSAEAAPVSEAARHEGHGGSQAIANIAARRAKAGKLVAGVAAAAHSDMFKGSTEGMPKAKRWTDHLSWESRKRGPCSLKQAAKHLKQPGMLSLGGGLPAPTVFPFASLDMTVPVPPGFSEAETLASGQTVRIGKYDVRDGQDAVYDLSIALNYGQATGSAQMLRFLTEHTEIVCRPPYADWGVCQTIGSTGALEQALRMFCDRDRHDSVLTEDFSFSTALETIEPLGVRVFGSPVDEQGLIPAEMDRLLSEWDPAARGGSRKPHLLYTVPSGQNPTGATQGPQRRRELYAVAQKHDLYIIEDEPYYFLQMPEYVEGQKHSEPQEQKHDTVDDFLASLIPSLVSIDVDGRVMRMDSLSKVVVPGSRLGWITASDEIIERYQRHAEVASQGPSGFSQVIMHKLLDETWGHEGYLQWLMEMRRTYTAKRNSLLAACEEHLPRDLVSWTPPVAGMFMWLTVDHTQHPSAGSRQLKDIEEEIFNSCIDNKVLVARGSWFQTEHDKDLPGLHFRATFASASADSMSEAIGRFGKAVKDSFGRN